MLFVDDVQYAERHGQYEGDAEHTQQRLLFAAAWNLHKKLELISLQTFEEWENVIIWKRTVGKSHAHAPNKRLESAQKIRLNLHCHSQETFEE